MFGPYVHIVTREICRRIAPFCLVNVVREMFKLVVVRSGTGIEGCPVLACAIWPAWSGA